MKQTKETNQAPPQWMYILPNAFTLGSLFAGFYAITLLGAEHPSSSHFFYAAIALLLATVCDGLDGRVARMTKTQSEFGLHMDSLVDVVSFGLAPAFLVYKWSLHEFGVIGMIAAFAFAGCGACRLARFNVIELAEKGKKSGPSRYFVGLPIPLAAGMLISIVMLLESMPGVALSNNGHWGVMGLTLLLATLMVSNVRFRTFKDLKMGPSTYAVLFLLTSLLATTALVFQPGMALVLLFASYVFVGVLGELFGYAHRLLKAARATSK